MGAFPCRFVLGVLGTIGVVAITVGCATTKGTVSADRYHAPSNNFSVAIPFHAARIQDDSDETGGYVSFVGLYGGLSSVYYERLPAEVKAIVDDASRRNEVFRVYLHQQALPNIFRRASPRSLLLHEEILSEPADRPYFVVVNIPEASRTFDVKKNQRLDSVRGLLIFGRGDYLYMLAEEMGSNPDWSRSVINRLLKTRDSMTFDR